MNMLKTTIAVLIMTVPAFAGAWPSPSGNADNFSYSNGGDINGYFGEPLIYGDTFYFINSLFHVNASNGQTDIQSDTVAFDVHANPGVAFSSITVTASGSYAVTGTGSSADVTAGVGIRELDGSSRSWNGELATDVSFPVTTGNGVWSGAASVDISFEFPAPSDNLHISLNNIVEAIAGAMGSSEINVQYQDLAITFNTIPEPATLSLLGIGLLALVRRR